jgi:hypothetical protein
MSTIQIEILNPKALKLIQDLADLELISIYQPKESGFSRLLTKLRSKAVDKTPKKEISDSKKQSSKDCFPKKTESAKKLLSKVGLPKELKVVKE